MRPETRIGLKLIAVLVMIGLILVFLVGCNKQIIDYNQHFEKGIVKLPNGEIIEGEVQSWTDFEDGDQLQIRIDGITYLVHSSNVALITRR